MKEDLVWYASYGSNMLRERFMHYIQGGEYEGKEHDGCDDKTPPRDDKPLIIKGYRMYFGNKSSGWDNRGVCFLEPKENEEALGRIYLITWEQFSDIRCQEGCGSYWYNEKILLNPEQPEDIPIYTITNRSKRNVVEPSQKYLDVVSRGIRETYPEMSRDKIDEYLNRCMGK